MQLCAVGRPHGDAIAALTAVLVGRPSASHATSQAYCRAPTHHKGGGSCYPIGNTREITGV
eukprot:2903209-Prymnesium_polylepis.1